MEFLGIDCANKTFAWVHIIVDASIIAKINCEFLDLLQFLGVDHKKSETFFDAVTAENIVETVLRMRNMNKLMSKFITFVSSGVNDNLCGLKVSECDTIARTKALHKFLQNRLPRERFINATVIIEHQPLRLGFGGPQAASNFKTISIGYQLAMYYAESNVVLICPKLKNNCEFGGLKYANFEAAELQKHKSNGKNSANTVRNAKYAARKKHSTAMMEHILGAFGLTGEISGVQNALINNIADAFMQIFAHIGREKLL